MSVFNSNGDITKVFCDIICHQVNCKGLMGSGLARQIKHISFDNFSEYRRLCKEYGSNMLGNIYIHKLSELDKRYICNIFGQDGYGRDKRYTDYDALLSGFLKLKDFMEKNGIKSAAIPYGIGAGLGGGDWNIIEKMIHQVFDESNLMIYIVRLQDDV